MASAAFDDTNWGNYFEIDSDNTLTDEAVGDSVYSTDIHPAPPAGFWNKVASDGADVRVVNSAGDTAYSFEIEEIDTTGENFTIFFDSQILQTGSDTTFRIYYNNSGATAPAEGDTLGKHNVWGADYQLRYGLGESSGSPIDSTSNSNDGTYNGDLPTQVSGKIGNAQDADGAGDYIDTPISTIQGSVTTSFWIKTTDQNWLMAITNDGTNAYYEVRSEAGDSDVFLRSDNGNVSLSVQNAAQVDDGNWHHVVTTIRVSTGTEIEMWIDGVSQGTDTSGSTEDLTIANTLQFLSRDETSDYLNGTGDEFRHLDNSVSGNWVSTHYNQQSNSNYWTVGAEQTVVGETSRKRIIIA